MEVGESQGYYEAYCSCVVLSNDIDEYC